jgi:coenzyme PQQ synthesis protein D (PqqD)
MALRADARVRIPDDVLFRELDGESVLLNLESGIYFGLDDVGTRIWQLLAEGRPIHDVRAQLAEEFDAPVEALDRDLAGFIEQLRAKGLVAVE